MERLKNKVIVITGGLGFFGLQFAGAISNEGGIPVLLDIYPYDKCLWHDYYKCDITNETEVKNTFKKIIKKYNVIDGLINNACNNPKMENPQDSFNKFEDFTLQQFKNDIDVSLVGTFLCTKYFGTYMENTCGGVIINIGSDLGIISPDQRIYPKNCPKPITYSVTKSALIGFTKYISTYWKNVRCNLVAFGGMYNKQPDEFVDKLTQLIPMGRMANKYEYDMTIIYLLSDDSSYMTGSVLTIDGGKTAW
jgi:NAD(P)-dependent dehydrogenase (short-subunit alcohol dehydrogenase family)